jgi:hypothetical protein
MNSPDAKSQNESDEDLLLSGKESKFGSKEGILKPFTLARR